MDLLVSGLVLLAICSIVAIVNVRKTNKVKEAETIKESCRLDGDTLFVSEQSNLISRILAIREHKLDQYAYNPEKIHVGAVTVGNVTTGGVYKTGGDYTTASVKDGKYELIYKKWEGGQIVTDHEVKAIVLSDELAAKAKNSAIGKYLTGNTIVVVQEIKPSDVFVELMSLGLTTRAVNQLAVEQAEGYPIRAKCEEVLDWLSAEEPTAVQQCAPTHQSVEEKAKKKKKQICLALIVCSVVSAIICGVGIYSVSAKNYAAHMIPLVTDALADTVWLNPKVAQYEAEFARIFNGDPNKLGLYGFDQNEVSIKDLYRRIIEEENDATVYKFTEEFTVLRYEPSSKDFSAWSEFDLDTIDTWDAPQEFECEVVRVKGNEMIINMNGLAVEYIVTFSENNGSIEITSITANYPSDRMVSGLLAYSPEHRAVTALEDLEFKYAEDESELELIRIGD